MSKAGYAVALVLTAIGAGAAGWYASKLYYDKKGQKLIETGRDPVKEEKKTEEPKEEKKVEPFKTKYESPEEKLAAFNSVKSLYSQALDKHNYTVPEEKDPADRAPIENSDMPYVVTHLDWGQPNGYDKIDLVYYEQDGIIADYENNIYNSEEIGDEFKENFDENDVVHVRNDSYMRDYEIVLDPRSFREATMGD